MSSVWRAEVSFDNVIATPAPDPTITWPVIGSNPAFWTGIGLIVSDGAGNQWIAAYGVIPTDSSLGPVVFKTFSTLIPRGRAFSFVDAADPWTWGFGFTDAQFFTAGSAIYTGGGTLAVTKNFGTNQITLTTPAGSATGTLNGNDTLRINSALNDTFIFPAGLAFTFSVPQDGGVHDPEATQSQVEFFDMQGKKDGILFFQHHLSSADPGVFFATAKESFTTAGTVGSDPSAFVVESQLTTRYLFNEQTSVITYPSFMRGNFWRNFATIPPMDNGTDMDIAPEHGVVWRGGADTSDGTVMLMQRTFDNAHSWETWTVFSDPTTSNGSPTVNWYNGRLYLTWFDGTNIRIARSLDGGRNWSVPTTIPFAGTNPRRVVDRTGGGAYLFYFVSGDLRVVVTYDGGGSYEGPYTIAGTVLAQQIDAEFVPDGSLVVSLFVSGNWTQYRSRDLGRTWS